LLFTRQVNGRQRMEAIPLCNPQAILDFFPFKDMDGHSECELSSRIYRNFKIIRRGNKQSAGLQYTCALLEIGIHIHTMLDDAQTCDRVNCAICKARARYISVDIFYGANLEWPLEHQISGDKIVISVEEQPWKDHRVLFASGIKDAGVTMRFAQDHIQS